MFGYVTPDQDELKGKDIRKYKEFYCGVCRDIKKHSGQLPRMFLTYDMTFLAILLSSLNEGEECRREALCVLHPFKKTASIQNEWTAYAADLNLLLVYHNLMDDWLDEKKVRSRAEAGLLERAYRKLAKQYPGQVQAIETYLRELHLVEQKGSRDLDLASGLTGTLFGELFSAKEQVWKEEVRQIGFFFGKWIYLMDAWADVEKDREKGNYNPFADLSGEPAYEEQAHRILMMMAAEMARAFERLPIVENVDILRNILYSGIWNTYRKLQKEKSNLQSKKGN